jgi:pimeloyl-ACP methyl ester carboxylesterase
VRDLLGVLGIRRATLIGHSLGGGVAMQFAYQFPERTERLVLVGSGGAGPEVSIALRALTLPGAQATLNLLRLPTARWQLGAAITVMRMLDTALGQDAPDLMRAVDALPDGTSRAAFIRALRAVVDWRGQVITMLDRCYLAAGMPTMLVWGSRDAMVPVGHGYRAHAAMPGSRLEVFEGAGHFPFHLERRAVASAAPRRPAAREHRPRAGRRPGGRAERNLSGPVDPADVPRRRLRPPLWRGVAVDAGER